MCKKLIHLLSFVLVLGLAGNALAEDAAPTVITDAAGLQAIADNLSGDYILGADIDLTGFDWQRIGPASANPFTGTFDGAYHIISGLTINASRGNLFSNVGPTAEIKNVGLTNVNIRAGWYAAALVGSLYGKVSNCFAIDGTITATQGDYGNVGTLIGLIRPGGSVTDCYSTMDLILEGGGSSQYCGGFTGGVAGPATNCYFAGEITGGAGPFAGYVNEGLATSCYYDTDVTGIPDGDLGRTTAEMMQESTYVGWDFANVWSIDEGQGYPQLQQPTVGPVGYWKLDETSGAIAQDSSGNGHDGVLSADPAPLWTTDSGRGNVLEFGPGLDYVDCGPGVSAGQDLTVALWIKPANVELMRPISCFDGDDYSENPGWFLMLRHDDWGEPPQVPPNAWFRMTGTEGEWNSGDLWINECWAPDEWVHMAFTFDEDTDTLSGYINGKLAGVTVVPEGRGVASDTNPLIMGHGGGTEQYEGLMDEVRIYDVVLTAAEIWNLVYPIAIPVPNGNFEEIYKPGSDTITADLGGGWTQGVGPNTPMDDGIATYSDGTTGDRVAIPGWIGADAKGWVDNGGTYNRDTSFPNRQGSVARQSDTPDGLYYYLSNGGGWGNPAGGLIVSDAPLATVEDGLTYTLSMLANGGATPVVLELLADGVALTPSSSVDPVLSGDWQEFSRTYDAASLEGHVGESLTIRLGVGRGASGGQSHFDAVSLSYVPEPPAPVSLITSVDRSNGTSGDRGFIGVFDGDTDPIPMEAGGLMDGAPVFSDRSYPWVNVPAEYVGSEYVSTFNTDKNGDSTEAPDATYEVTISQPAFVWITIDDRIDAAIHQDIADQVTSAFADPGTFVDTGVDLFIREREDGSLDSPISVFGAELPAGTYVFSQGAIPGFATLYVIGAMPQQ